MAEFQIKGDTYQARTLSAMEQFHLGRKLAPVLSFLATNRDKSKLEEVFPRAFTALSGHISDEDMEAVRKSCFGAVSRRQQTGWHQIAPNGILMFSDIDTLPAMLTIILHVLETNGLFDFFAEPLSVLDQGTAERTS
jgi:hypothetical protein